MITARTRIQSITLDALKTQAQARNLSTSAYARSIVKPYITGERSLPTIPKPPVKQFVFSCEAEEAQALKTMCQQSGMSWEEATRAIFEQATQENAE